MRLLPLTGQVELEESNPEKLINYLSGKNWIQTAKIALTLLHIKLFARKETRFLMI